MIHSVNITNFMAISSLENKEISPITILIGKNDTCKTAVLKLLYSVVKSLEIYSIQNEIEATENLSTIIRNKIISVFSLKDNNVYSLIKNNTDKCSITLEVEDIKQNKYRQSIVFHDVFNSSTNLHIESNVHYVPKNTLNSIFIPAKEVLTAFNDIQIMREQFFGKGFDDTYLDLINMLKIPTRLEGIDSSFLSIMDDLSALLQGEIVKTTEAKDFFVFRRKGINHDIRQTAEGIKKIGVLDTLIRNGRLRKGTILFIDEPENNLHPSAIRALVNMLMELSRQGVQIFISTHNYFVLKQFAVCAKRDKTDVVTWNMERDENDSVVATFSSMKDGILPDNDIVNESLSMFDDELQVMYSE